MAAFSPLHVLLASLNSAVSLRAFDAITFLYLFLGGVSVILFFHDRGWHGGGALVAAMAFALGGSANARMQHTVQIVSLAFLPLALWLTARALERSSWQAGIAAGAVVGLLAVVAIRSPSCPSMCSPVSCWRIGSSARSGSPAYAPASGRWSQPALPPRSSPRYRSP